MRGKSFSLDLIEKEQAVFLSSNNTTELWHERMEHFSHAALLLMNKMELVRGLPSLEINHDTTLHFWGPTPSKQENPGSKSIKKNKPALILIHGFGPLAVWQWRSQVQSLSPFFNLYVPDLVFFGGSSTSCSERSEVFQAESVGRLMEKLGVESYSVMGTSYGGFVSYHVARMWPERVEKVVIASSGVNMTTKDGEELMRRANVEKLEDLMLPHTPSQLRTLMRLAIFKPVPRLPDFFLHHFLRVRAPTA
ncbi:Alpha/beta hydrolase fold-1 [Dillenia turbinata]|uniref:Alpha/beta hydrolase fold-1 n=1 Tax=Dillenia turbinata TaxID=194707 RepID=A0AAN8V4H5_9MAGN